MNDGVTEYVGVTELVREIVGVTDLDVNGEMDAEALIVYVADTLAVTVNVGVNDGVDDQLPDTDVVVDGETLRVLDCVTVLERDGENDAEAVDDAVAVDVADAVSDAVSDGESDGVSDGESDAVYEGDVDGEIDTDAVYVDVPDDDLQKRVGWANTNEHVT